MTPNAPVVDASVAIKWLVEEPLSANARALFQATTQAGLLPTAPLHLPSEVTNGLYQQVRRGNLTATDAEQALARFGRIRMLLLAPETVYAQALGFAHTHALGATYDSLYVVLARLLGTTFWTADQRLLGRVGPTVSWVRWIGDYH